MYLQAASITLCAALAFSCTPKNGPSPAQQPAQQQEPSQEEGTVITGILEPTVEAGGWLCKGEERSYLLLGIEEYRTKPWFKSGQKVQVRGEEDTEVITIYQQGTPFKVSSMEPVE